MARPISDEELQLKKRARRRLIGAIVLVTAVVVLLPMVLDSEPRPISQDVEIRIPSPDPGMFTSRVVPVAPALESKTPPKPPAAAAVKGEPTPAVGSKVPKPPRPPVSAPTPEALVAKEASKAGPVPEAARAAASPRASDPISRKSAEVPAGKFVVQVVALADAEKAKQKQAEIAAAGLPSYTEVVKTVKGDVTRVRAGPFATRKAAEKASEQLRALGMNGNITTK